VLYDCEILRKTNIYIKQGSSMGHPTNGPAGSARQSAFNGDSHAIHATDARTCFQAIAQPDVLPPAGGDAAPPAQGGRQEPFRLSAGAAWHARTGIVGRPGA